VDLQLIGTIVAVILTLMVYSYLIGDNPLYRLAQHIFVGVSVGYITLVVIYNVIGPFVGRALEDRSWPDRVLPALALLLGVLLWFKVARPRNVFSNAVLAIIVTTAAALGLGGTLVGTLLPQMQATMLPLTGDLYTIVGNLVVIVGVIASLGYFYFTARADGSRTVTASYVATAGRWFMMVAFGTLFGFAVTSFFALLADRIKFLITLGS
jgi:hypothetical protein